jgi:hypothetical protein
LVLQLTPTDNTHWSSCQGANFGIDGMSILTWRYLAISMVRIRTTGLTHYMWGAGKGVIDSSYLIQLLIMQPFFAKTINNHSPTAHFLILLWVCLFLLGLAVHG